MQKDVKAAASRSVVTARLDTVLEKLKTEGDPKEKYRLALEAKALRQQLKGAV